MGSYHIVDENVDLPSQCDGLLRILLRLDALLYDPKQWVLHALLCQHVLASSLVVKKFAIIRGVVRVALYGTLTNNWVGWGRKAENVNKDLKNRQAYYSLNPNLQKCFGKT